jgi:hypothetical protein
MPRPLIAVLVGLVGFAAYIAAAVTLADPLLHGPWPVQTLYFLVAGVAWVFPARWLMIWAARA